MTIPGEDHGEGWRPAHENVRELLGLPASGNLDDDHLVERLRERPDIHLRSWEDGLFNLAFAAYIAQDDGSAPKLTRMAMRVEGKEAMRQNLFLVAYGATEANLRAWSPCMGSLEIRDNHGITSQAHLANVEKDPTSPQWVKDLARDYFGASKDYPKGDPG